MVVLLPCADRHARHDLHACTSTRQAVQRREHAQQQDSSSLSELTSSALVQCSRGAAELGTAPNAQTTRRHQSRRATA